MTSINQSHCANFVDAASTMVGMTPLEFSDYIKTLIRSENKELGVAKNPVSKRTVVRPDTNAKDLPIGFIMTDNLGRKQIVVEQRAFKGTAHKWKIVREGSNDNDMVGIATEVPHIEKTPLTPVENSDCMSDQSKRRYTVNRPTENSSDHPVGYTAQDSIGRIHMVVERSAFNGTAKRWILVPDIIPPATTTSTTTAKMIDVEVIDCDANCVKGPT